MRVSSPTGSVAPTGNGTTTLLFNSFVHFAGLSIDVHSVERFEVTVDNAQAGSIRITKLDDNGVATGIIQQVAVTIPVGPLTASGPIDFAVDGLRHFKAEWINGAVDQTTWHIDMKLVEMDRAAQA